MAEDIMLVIITHIITHTGERCIKPEKMVKSVEVLKNFICGKWNHLSNVELYMFYTVGRYSNCLLKDDNDYESMTLMCNLVGERCIDVVVVKDTCHLADKNINIDTSDSNAVNEPPQVVDEIAGAGNLMAFKPPVYDMCPDIEPVPLLSASWNSIIKGVGQVFRGGRAEFRRDLIKYATKCGFAFKFDKNNAQYIYVSCAGKEGFNCRWFIRGKEVFDTGYFEITKMNLQHDCVGNIVANQTACIGPKMWSNMVLENVRSRPTHPGTDMQIHIKLAYGFDIPYYKAWRSVDAARALIYGSFKKSFDQLRWYCEAVLRTNPGSYAFVLHHPVTKCFTNAFFSFQACLEGFKACRPMLFIDATFMHGRTKACILSAIAKDGNNGLFPVAFAIVMGETLENWKWFLEHIKEVVKHEQEVFYVSDRNAGLLSAFKLVWEEPKNFYCLFHLHNNLKVHYSGGWSTPHRKKMCALLTECAYAPNIRVFDEKVQKFLMAGGSLAQPFLDSIPYHKWAVAHAPHVMRYGDMTSNAAESFNKWILVARSLPVTFLVDTIRSDIMRWFVERREKARKWTSVLCPKRQDICNYHVELSRTWFVLETPSGKYEVRSKTSVVVDMEKRECSCSQWQIHGFPCVMRTLSLRSTVNRSLKLWRTISLWMLTKNAIVVTSTLCPTRKDLCYANNEEESILPPVKKNLPRRPNKKRKRSYMEVPKEMPKVCPSCGLMSRHDPLTCINNGEL